MSNELRFALCNILSVLELQASHTKNPIDDIIVKGLKALAGCPEKTKAPAKPKTPSPSMN